MKVRRNRESVITAGGQVTEWKRLPYLSPFKPREKYSWSTCLLSPHFCLNQRHLLQIKDVFLFWKKSVKSQPQRHERSAGSTLDRELKRRMQGVEGYREAEWLGITERRRRLKIKKKWCQQYYSGWKWGQLLFSSLLFFTQEMSSLQLLSFTAEFCGWKFLCKTSGRSSFFFHCFNFFLIWSASDCIS